MRNTKSIGESIPCLTELRTKQINKILSYASDILNVDVRFISPEEMGNDSGGYFPPADGDRAEIHVESHGSSLQIIFILLHELGHHIDYIKRGVLEDEELAYQKYPESYKQAPCPTVEAEKITFIEEQAIEYSKELNDYLHLDLPPYSMLRDEYYTRDSLEYLLRKGFTTRRIRRNIRKNASERARKELERRRKENSTTD